MAAPYVLTYDAPVVCPADAQVRDDVASHVHDESRADGVKVTLRITQRGARFSGELVVVDVAGKAGRRAIEDGSCADVSHALAFLAGLAIDLGGHFEDDAAPPSPPPPHEPPPPPPAQPLPPGWSLGLMVGARGGLAPTIRPAGEVFVTFETRSLALRPAVRASLVVAGSHLESPSGAADLVLFGARVEGCPFWIGNPTIGVRPCAGVEGGAIVTRSLVPVDPRSPTEAWLAADVSLHVEWTFARHVFLEIASGFMFPILRTHFFFQQPDRALYAVPSVTARTGLAFGVHFF